jgi:glycosyltransferase involved in cell wall biosynthesis
MSLDILIPTYNRQLDLIKNLKLLSIQIQKLSDSSLVNIIISDNASTDETILSIEHIKKNFPTSINVLNSSTNLGLESNVVKVLSASNAEWVMFLGDDDFLPDEYIQFVIDQIKANKIGCIIPGFSSLYKDGSVIVTRKGESVKTKPGLSAILNLSQFGHQLSGLVIHRDQTLEKYLSKPNFRNIYPFIYFISFNLNKYDAIYVPQFQVLVSQGNTKDWGYDESGLLTEVYQNYLSLFVPFNLS